MLIKRLIHSPSRGFPQWVELHYDDMDSTLPGLCLVWAATGQSRPGCGGRRGWAGPQEGGPRRMEVGRGKRMVAIITCLQDCRNCFRVILLGDNRVKKILTLPTIQLKLAIMIVFTTLITSMRYRVFCLVAWLR